MTTTAARRERDRLGGRSVLLIGSCHPFMRSIADEARSLIAA